jgi:hypothetical protein
MRKFVALLLCLFVPTMAFAEPSNNYKVKYDGGSLMGVKAGDNATLRLSAKDIEITDGKGVVIATVPAAAVTEVSYGQDVHRRIGTAIGLAVISLGIGALMAFSKSKKHFVGITWVDGEKKGGFAMQCDKNEYRGILAGIEGITGKKAVNSDAMTVKN